MTYSSAETEAFLRGNIFAVLESESRHFVVCREFDVEA
jgi:hypothetical protein